MTEQEARDKVAGFAEDCARSGNIYTGSAGLQELIDIYNDHRPLARGLEYSYNLGGWCELFADVCFIATDEADIITTEIGPWEAMQAAKKAGIWKPRGSYTPKRGDKIYYAYQQKDADGKDYTQFHVGMVTNASASLNVVYSTEGNVKQRVLMLEHRMDDKTILGYIAPDFASLATKEIPAQTIPPLPAQNGTYTLDGVVSNNKAELRWVKKNA